MNTLVTQLENPRQPTVQAIGAQVYPPVVDRYPLGQLNGLRKYAA